MQYFWVFSTLIDTKTDEVFIVKFNHKSAGQKIIHAWKWIINHKYVVGFSGVVVLFGVLLSFTLGSSSSNPFLPYYTPYQVSEIPENIAPWEFMAYDRYSDEKYDLAVTLLENLVLHNPKAAEEHQFMLGTAYLELGRPGDAVNVFTKLSRSRSGLIRRHGLWYLAIAQVKAGDQKGAHITLNRLLQSPGEYHANAMELRDLLDV